MQLTAVKLLGDSGVAWVQTEAGYSAEQAGTEVGRWEVSLPIDIFHVHVNTSSQDSSSSISNLGDCDLPLLRRQTSCGLRTQEPRCGKCSTLWEGLSRSGWLLGQVLLSAFELYWRWKGLGVGGPLPHERPHIVQGLALLTTSPGKVWPEAHSFTADFLVCAAACWKMH